MRSRIVRMLSALALVALAAPGAGAQEAESAVVAQPGAFFTTYATPLVVVQEGGALTFTNLDVPQHNVVQDVAADGFAGPDTQPWCDRFEDEECPLFWTPLIGLTEDAPVQGLENAEAGTVYSFYCTIHPNMVGKLVVAPGGA